MFSQDERTPVELLDIANILQALDDFTTLTILQLLQRRVTCASPLGLAQLARMDVKRVEASLEALIDAGIVCYTEEKQNNPPSQFVMLNPDMPDIARTLIQAIWPDTTLPQAKPIVVVPATNRAIVTINPIKQYLQVQTTVIGDSVAFQIIGVEPVQEAEITNGIGS